MPVGCWTDSVNVLEKNAASECVNTQPAANHHLLRTGTMAETVVRRKPRRIKYDLSGQRFGQLVAVERIQTPKGWRWRCICDCGADHLVMVGHLRSGHLKSCGGPAHPPHNLRHGHCRPGRITSEFRSYQKMLSRCGNPNDPKYPRYGGRGIAVCARWQERFENFFADMGSKPSPAHSIERKDNDGHYEPDNCVWATSQEQARNRSTARLLTYNGETKALWEWSEIKGIHPESVSSRIKLGWSVEDALDKPVRGRLVTYRGETRQLNEWAKVLGLCPQTLRLRYVKGWPVERLLSPSERPRRSGGHCGPETGERYGRGARRP